MEAADNTAEVVPVEKRRECLDLLLLRRIEKELLLCNGAIGYEMAACWADAADLDLRKYLFGHAFGETEMPVVDDSVVVGIFYDSHPDEMEVTGLDAITYDVLVIAVVEQFSHVVPGEFKFLELIQPGYHEEEQQLFACRRGTDAHAVVFLYENALLIVVHKFVEFIYKRVAVDDILPIVAEAFPHPLDQPRRA